MLVKNFHQPTSFSPTLEQPTETSDGNNVQKMVEKL